MQSTPSTEPHTTIDFSARVTPAALSPAGDAHRVRLLILGSGPAGLTAAIYAGRADLRPVVIAGNASGGQLMTSSAVENYPGFPDGVEGPDLMALFRAQAERFGAEVLESDVERVDLTPGAFRVWAGGQLYAPESIIIATGAEALWLDIESESRLRGRGVSACATCDGFFFRDRRVAVVGGGDTAFEEALFLTRFASHVQIIARRPVLRASKILIERARAHPKIEIMLGYEVIEILGDDRVNGIRIMNTSTRTERMIALEGVFVAIGHRPNTGLFVPWLAADVGGYLLAHNATKTRVPGVFVAGDVHDPRYRQAVTAAGDGARAAIDAEHWITHQAVIDTL